MTETKTTHFSRTPWRTALATVLASAAWCAQATEFRSTDTHNADDYPTVAAVRHMSRLLEQKSGGKPSTPPSTSRR